ncbi:MAG TPA: F0F1 ATP synthase subunit delta, partial [Anaerolineae bacterium]|nr:F0F1 ATP synthase subunit delta [Anaerolineae bacterium]
FEVEPSLLGGVRVRVGDEVIDGSVKSKLDALAQSLAQSR